jgi:hypothetical protein
VSLRYRNGAYNQLSDDCLATKCRGIMILANNGGKTEVAAVVPVASMQAIQNPALEAVAVKVRKALEAAVQAV